MKASKVFSLLFLSLCLNLKVATESQASTAISDISDASSTFTFNRNWGWEFIPNQDISLTKLGLWDKDSNGFFGSHDVGVWNASQDLLTSVTITSSSIAEGNSTNSPAGIFRYESVPEPVNLLAGNSYAITAVYYQSGNSDSFINKSTAIMSPEITLGNTVHSSTSSTLRYPYESLPSYNDGVFGTNFQYETTAVPVPFELQSDKGIILVLIGFGLSKLIKNRSVKC